MSNGVLVLFSGGLDSTVALIKALHEQSRVHALTIGYGQRHGPRESRAAERIALRLEVKQHIEDIHIPWHGAALTTAGMPLDGALAVLPGRNTILATVAAAAAMRNGLAEVWMGCCAADAALFPDCRREWVEAMNEVLAAAFDGVRLVAPFIDMEKRDVVRLARRLGREDLLAETWSCYTPVVRGPCGACGACAQRALGFAAAGMVDPTAC